MYPAIKQELAFRSLNDYRRSSNFFEGSECKQANFRLRTEPRPKDILSNLSEEFAPLGNALLECVIHILDALAWDVRLLPDSKLPSRLVSKLNSIEPLFGESWSGLSASITASPNAA